MTGGDLDDVSAEVSDRAAGPAFIQRLAERVGANASAAAIFGEPVEREGVTVIPVARAVFGFGGGSGENEGQVGAGGGGGGMVKPLGYIEVRNGVAEFKPLRDPRLPLLAAATVGIALVAGLRARGRG